MPKSTWGKHRSSDATGLKNRLWEFIVSSLSLKFSDYSSLEFTWGHLDFTNTLTGIMVASGFNEDTELRYDVQTTTSKRMFQP